ncbi:hypothetical protein ABW19_dt0207873 [Dactylella cylindrospora]|nr:hypothetical protein ABW19_dt0207873 [Dactylella cylindrospora]
MSYRQLTIFIQLSTYPNQIYSLYNVGDVMSLLNIISAYLHDLDPASFQIFRNGIRLGLNDKLSHGDRIIIAYPPPNTSSDSAAGVAISNPSVHVRDNSSFEPRVRPQNLENDVSDLIREIREMVENSQGVKADGNDGSYNQDFTPARFGPPDRMIYPSQSPTVSSIRSATPQLPAVEVETQDSSENTGKWQSRRKPTVRVFLPGMKYPVGLKPGGSKESKERFNRIVEADDERIEEAEEDGRGDEARLFKIRRF